MSYLNLKKNIQIKLDENQMNPSDLERKAGLSASSVRKILLGSSQNPTLETLRAIADVFGCSIDDLVGKRVFSNDSYESILFKNLPWNSQLIKAIITATCDHIEKNKLHKTFEEVMVFVAKTYNYCLVKKGGTFDKDFHEWYIQQNLL